MSTCSIQDSNTKEPKIFYKSDQGVEYSSLYDVLNNSQLYYQTGVKNQAEDFVQVLETPIFDKSTQQGQIQSYIRNGYLTGSQVAPNTFEATDSYAAEILETELLLNEFNTFKRSGLKFEFGDFKPKLNPKSNLKTVLDSGISYLRKKTRAKEPRPIKYTEDQLKIMIENFMKKMGYSITSIENYRKNYETKFGVEPDAEALIDFNAQVIAFSKGEITLDGLSEEFSHFVIEAWNQDDIQRILPYINNTQEYIENAEKYRGIYSKQISDPILIEQAVRREILGQMLSNSLQKGFSTESRTEIEKNIFQKLADILRQFLNFAIGNITPDIESEIDLMATEIKNRLYNDNLEKSLNTNISPVVELMYSLDKKSATDIKNKLKEFNNNTDRYNSELERQVDELFNTAYSTAIAANNALEKSNGIHNIELDSTILSVLDMDDLLAEVKSAFRQMEFKFQDQGIQDSALRFRDNLLKKADRTLREISDLKGNYKYSQQKDAETEAREALERETNLGSEKIEEMVNDSKIGVNAIQKDTNAFIKLFGHTFKTSNIFVGLLAKIIENLHTAKIINFESDVKQFLLPLKDARNKLKSFVKYGNFRSGIDIARKEADERAYELSILSKVIPNKFEKMDLEKYTEYFQEKNGTPISTTDDRYFEYRYEYDQGLINQKWVPKKNLEYKTKFIQMLNQLNLGELPWKNEFYKYLITKSNNRFRNTASSIQADRDMANPYYNNGTLKTGFQAMYYRDALVLIESGKESVDNLVSVNPRHTFQTGTKTDPEATDIVFLYDKGTRTNPGEVQQKTDGSNAFQSMKWNAIRAGSIDESIRDNIQKNFKEEYQSQKKVFQKQGLTGMDLNQALNDWLQDSLLFEPSEEYWNSFEPSDIRFRDFYRKVSKGDSNEKMTGYERQYKEIQLQKKLILKKYKSQNDYKEIDVNSMSTLDKNTIFNLETQLAEIQKDIAEVFEIHNLGDIYSESKATSSLKLNQAFHENFQNTIGKSWDDDTLTEKELELFFSNSENLESGRYGTYLKLKKELKSTRKSGLVDRYRKVATENKMGNTDQDVLKAFLMSKAPSWYKRYDANEKYDNFIRDFKSGKIDIESLLDNYIQNPNVDQITYRQLGSEDSQIIPMKLSPSFKYSVPSEPNVKELLTDYLELSNDSKADLMLKYDLLQKMGGVNDIDSTYSEDMTDILNDPENLKTYIQMMDLQMQRLTRDQMLKKHHIFSLPQVRKSTFERFEAFGKDRNKLAQIQDYVKEVFTFREDDFEDSYKSLKIPHYGYYKLNPEEITDDIFYALSWGLNNANHYEQRFLAHGNAVNMMRGLESQEFKGGKKATDTNYHKMMQEMMDFNFYGKTTTNKIEFELFGKPYDLSKFLFMLKGFSITSALAFSPIVAATNLSSGVIQNMIMSATGRNIYSPSNSRAVQTLAKLFPDSIQDVGRFDPESKINKIMYSYGIYDLSERFQNAKFNRGTRLLPEISFGMMALTNFPLQAQSTLTKLMEYRLMDDGTFKSWRQFSIEEKTRNPGISEKEIKSIFEARSKYSMYDYMDDNGQLNLEKLRQDEYKSDPVKDKKMVMSAISNITELTTMEIAKHHEGSGGRNPAWSFILSLKKWLVIATSTMTSRERYDLDTGGKEQGLAYSFGTVYNLLKGALKDRQNFRESYNQLSEVERKNIRTGLIMLGMLTVLLSLAIVLKKAADDDDEEDNYLLQLSAYMALRNVNEAFSGNIGIAESYFEAIQNPIMVGSTIKNLTNVVKFGDIGKEVETGKYEGQDKYWSGIMKATWLRNPYTISSTHALQETRKSYLHFNTQDSFYHIFDLIPKAPTEDEK